MTLSRLQAGDKIWCSAKLSETLFLNCKIMFVCRYLHKTLCIKTCDVEPWGSLTCHVSAVSCAAIVDACLSYRLIAHYHSFWICIILVELFSYSIFHTDHEKLSTFLKGKIDGLCYSTKLCNIVEQNKSKVFL